MYKHTDIDKYAQKSIALAVKYNSALRKVVNEIFDEGLVSNHIQIKSIISNHVDEYDVENVSDFVIYFYSTEPTYRIEIFAEINSETYAEYGKWAKEGDTNENIKAGLREFILKAIQNYKNKKVYAERTNNFDVEKGIVVNDLSDNKPKSITENNLYWWVKDTVTLPVVTSIREMSLDTEYALLFDDYGRLLVDNGYQYLTLLYRKDNEVNMGHSLSLQYPKDEKKTKSQVMKFMRDMTELYELK